MPQVLKSHAQSIGPQKRQADALRRVRGARSHMTGIQRGGHMPPAQTPSAVKEEIAREYRDLARTIEENERTVADSAKPTGIFGRWFHTSTS